MIFSSSLILALSSSSRSFLRFRPNILCTSILRAQAAPLPSAVVTTFLASAVFVAGFTHKKPFVLALYIAGNIPVFAVIACVLFAQIPHRRIPLPPDLLKLFFKHPNSAIVYILDCTHRTGDVHFRHASCAISFTINKVTALST
jgi:hypothetical protein